LDAAISRRQRTSRFRGSGVRARRHSPIVMVGGIVGGMLGS
jgi:hypothetical protein